MYVLQENDMKKVAKMAVKFDKKVKEIVSAIGAGVNLFKDLVGGKISFKEIVNEFISALQELPGKVSNSNKTGLSCR
jgi:hypothetical protein